MMILIYFLCPLLIPEINNAEAIYGLDGLAGGPAADEVSFDLCPPRWVKTSDACYLKIKTRHNYAEGEKLCAKSDKRATLPWFCGPMEQINFMKVQKFPRKFWLGLVDKELDGIFYVKGLNDEYCPNPWPDFISQTYARKRHHQCVYFDRKINQPMLQSCNIRAKIVCQIHLKQQRCGEKKDESGFDGEDAFEGDIIFPEGHNIWSYAKPLTSESGEAGTLESAINTEYRLWKDGIVPYSMSPNMTNKERGVVEEAILEFSKHSCINWVPRNQEKDYVLIKKGKLGSGCRSYVGKHGWINVFNLGPHCFKKGIIMHEMMHTMGFFHEQSRADRDKFVTINWDNIRKSKHQNFLTYTLDQIDHLGTKYDCDSIMHYGRKDFTSNGKETITPITPKCKNIGQREKFSAIDIKDLNLLYKCERTTNRPTVTKPTEMPNPAYPIILMNAISSSEAWWPYRKLWKNGVVPYVLSPDMTNKQKDAVKEAMKEFPKHSCIKWVPRKNKEDYVVIKRTGSTNCHLVHAGKTESVNKLNLGSRCFKKRIILQGMMHTLGFFWEQHRADRDKYVTVSLENAISKYYARHLHKFNLPHFGQKNTFPRTKYDCDSIMHLPKNAFAKPKVLDRGMIIC